VQISLGTLVNTIHQMVKLFFLLVNVPNRDCSRKMSMVGLVSTSMNQNTIAVHVVKVERRRQLKLRRNGISVTIAKRISAMIYQSNFVILETITKSVMLKIITLTSTAIKIVVQDLKLQLEQTRLEYI
jgi:hypothetical protein